jgi:lipid-binding SYLF domain-containing protein
MNPNRSRALMRNIALAVAAACAAAVAPAQTPHPNGTPGKPDTPLTPTAPGTPIAAPAHAPQAGMQSDRSTDRNDDRPDREDQQQVLREVDKGVQVVQHMKADPKVRRTLSQARGVFVLPAYGRGALGVGFQGGEGMLLERQGKRFSNPVFYNLGGVSVGAQAGGSGGPVVFLLMTDRAVAEFASDQKFSLNADAGLTIANWSRRAQASGGKVQDVIVWSQTKGAYVGASIGLTDVMLDTEANRAYYGRAGLSPREIIDGKAKNPHSNVLGRVLGV